MIFFLHSSPLRGSTLRSNVWDRIPKTVDNRTRLGRTDGIDGTLPFIYRLHAKKRKVNPAMPKIRSPINVVIEIGIVLHES